MDPILKGLAPYAGTLIGSGVVGFASGWFLKKAIKVILLVAGAIATLLIILAYQKLITVNWAAIQHQSNDLAQQGLHTMTDALANANAHMPTNADFAYPITGAVGFLPCFAWGFMHG